ncbi:MAG TPA: FAD-dependent oxidoreductase [Solirubrobacterales bacterium]|nr:FAD-dependent oxidoreductase [Solirubrobacterales bacterium]
MSVTVGVAKSESIWIDTGPPQPAHPTLDEDVRADVVVIGGGIVGITTALLLAEAGADVVLLEANQLARGVSGHTTAKVSSQHGLVYDRLRSTFGETGARTYGQANQAALEWIAERVRRDRIECDFRRRPSYTYVTSDSKRSGVEDEARAAVKAGLPATLVETTPLPYPVAAAVRFDGQAEFHARKYLLALADRLSEAGCRIYEHSHAVEVDTDEDCVVKTPGGRVTADRVVVATHYPFLDRSLAFARIHPQRSYAIVCRIADGPPAGMFISGDSPTRSVRTVPIDGQELLLVGGEGHKTGTGGDTEERYRRLEQFARDHWDVESVEYRWSSQDNTTIDGVPYIGPLTPRAGRVFMATGFAKWGITNGTAAALILADSVRDREHPWAELFNSNRLKPLASAATFVKENAQVGLRFIGDRVTKPGTRSLEELAPGEGDIVQHDGEKIAGYRDDQGELVTVSTRCTHLGCQVNWNAAERSWDCPCHGSRFAPTGEVLHGPAVHRLERKPLD